MVRCLLAFLLICGLALPAVAAPWHCLARVEPVAAQHHSEHGAHHGQSETAPTGKAMMAQDCLGCAALKAPPHDGTFSALITVMKAALPQFTALAGRSVVPDTPPPRSGS